MKTLFALCAMLFACSLQAEDMYKYLADTKDMVRQGKHQMALDRFIWFHEHALEKEPAMSGVRVSFALAEWKSLGDVYPPAAAALREMSARTAKQVLQEEGGSSQFDDVAAINKTLGEEAKTVKLFETIDQTKPELAKRYWDGAKDAVLKAKRYDLVRKYLGDPAKELAQIKKFYEELTTMYDRVGDRVAGFKSTNENHFVEQTLQLIAAVRVISSDQAAQEIQQKALAVVDDKRLRDAIPATPKQKIKG